MTDGLFDVSAAAAAITHDRIAAPFMSALRTTSLQGVHRATAMNSTELNWNVSSVQLRCTDGRAKRRNWQFCSFHFTSFRSRMLSRIVVVRLFF